MNLDVCMEHCYGSHHQLSLIAILYGICIFFNCPCCLQVAQLDNYGWGDAFGGSAASAHPTANGLVNPEQNTATAPRPASISTPLQVGLLHGADRQRMPKLV